MRNLIAASLLAALLLCCKSTPPVVAKALPYGMTNQEEATILRLEDRREYDSTIAADWLHRDNSIHRARMALALGRIGTQTFEDANQNGVRDEGETMAGVPLLVAAAADPAFEVRRNVAFALGEIGDPAGIDALLKLAADEHADVAAEAVEGLSKFGAAMPLEHYVPLTRDARDGVRGRAVRFLFRLASDEAQNIAAASLAATGMIDRREAAYSLSRRAYAPARPRLELLLTDNDTLTRAYAARALGLINDPLSLTPLFRAIEDVHPWVRTNAVRAIGQIGEKHAEALRSGTTGEDVLHLVTLTSDADPGTAAAAIETVAQFAASSEPARERLTRIAVSGSSVQREIATGAIAHIYGLQQGSPLPALLETDSPWIKVRVLEGTTKGVDGVALRKHFATDPDPMVRTAVLSAVDDVDRELELIRDALSDNDPVVRATAIEKFATSKAVSLSEKVRLLGDAERRGQSDGQDDARLAAITALGTLDYPDRESMLRRLLSDRDPVARRIAAEALVALKKPRPQFTPLSGLAESSDPQFYERVAEWSHHPHTATIHLQRGAIELVLLPQDAPLTTWNFATLARRGYFDRTSFMRVVPNFVVQGGDPRNDMSGGPGYAIRDEINLQKYTRGAVGMALSGPDTGGSQFFITHSPQPHLDGGYTIFGRVVEGMDAVVDKIERGEVVNHIGIDEHPALEVPAS